MRIEKNINYASLSEKDYLDIYHPDKPNGEVIVHFHGGGLTSGDKEYVGDLPISFASRGYTFVSVGYSLFPNSNFPRFLYEAAASISFIMNYLKVRHVYVGGQSAGCYIAMMLCFDKKYLSSYGVDPMNIKGWFFESGQPTTHFHLLEMEGYNPWIQRIDEKAPIYYVGPTTKFTKALFIYYTHDMPSRLEQNRLMISTIRNFNKEAIVKDVLLEGNHCDGSSKKDIDGEYPYVKEVIKFIEENI